MSAPQSKWDEIPDYKLGETPEELPDENPGLYRLIIIKRALEAAYEDAEPGIVDLLADVRHLCDHLGLAFEEIDQDAQRWYWQDKLDWRRAKGEVIEP